MFKRFFQIKPLAFISILFALMFFGCSADENIMTPEARTTPGEYTSVDEVMSIIKMRGISNDAQTSSIQMAPPQPSLYFHAESFMDAGRLGGAGVARGTKVYFPVGSLSQETLVWMDVRTDESRSYLDFDFGPHGLTFPVPVEVKLSWSTMKDVTAKDLILYYYDETIGDWVEESRAIWNDKGKHATLYLNHFSQYYYSRQ